MADGPVPGPSAVPVTQTIANEVAAINAMVQFGLVAKDGDAPPTRTPEHEQRRAGVLHIGRENRCRR